MARSFGLVAIAFALFASSCGSKEDASLSAYVATATLSKDASPFGSKLDGQATIVLDMGSYSSGSVTIDSITMRLFRGANNAILTRATISPAAGAPSFPLQVAAKSQTSIAYTITLDQLTDAEITELCSGPVTVSGTVEQEGLPALPIGTTPITPSGC